MLNNILQYCMKKYEDIRQMVKDITDSIGYPNGIAPLDEQGKIPSEYQPIPMQVGADLGSDGF